MMSHHMSVQQLGVAETFTEEKRLLLGLKWNVVSLSFSLLIRLRVQRVSQDVLSKTVRL